MRTAPQTVPAIAATLVLAAALLTSSPAFTADTNREEARMLLTDFTTDSPDLDWYVQNDNVMGGRSQGGFETSPGELRFAGNTNTRGGGFSSIRTRRFKLDLSDYDGIELRVKADGRQYIWQLQSDARYRGFKVSYWAEFDTVAGEWATVRIPFTKFYPQVRGFRLDGPEFDPAGITEFGLYIYDGNDGPFELRLDSVHAYSDAAP